MHYLHRLSFAVLVISIFVLAIGTFTPTVSLRFLRMNMAVMAVSIIITLLTEKKLFKK